MGIDNDSKLIFGRTLDYEEILRIGEAFNINIIDVLRDESDNNIYEKFPNLYLGYASPYYDASEEHCIYFVGICPAKDNFTLEDMNNFITNWENSGYKEFLELCGLSYADPLIISLPHIW